MLNLRNRMNQINKNFSDFKHVCDFLHEGGTEKKRIRLRRKGCVVAFILWEK